MIYKRKNGAGGNQNAVSNTIYLGGLGKYENKIKCPEKQVLSDKEYEYLYSLLCTLKDGVAADYLWCLVKQEYVGGHEHYFQYTPIEILEIE